MKMEICSMLTINHKKDIAVIIRSAAHLTLRKGEYKNENYQENQRSLCNTVDLFYTQRGHIQLSVLYL